MAKKEKPNVKQIVTDRLIDALTKAIESGDSAPWKKTWSGGGGLPTNAVSKKVYRGINVFLLSMMGYESPTWLTYKQAKELGGTVKKGEKSTPVLFWNWIYKDANGKTTKDRTQAVEKIPFIRYYSAFNIAQCEGVDDPWTPPVDNDHDPIADAVAVVDGMKDKPAIEHGEARAYYRPSTDTVNMPRLGLFDTPEDYHHTLFHELVHSTGHDSRLKREGITGKTTFGSTTYSKEELVAELGAAILCGHCGISNEALEENTVAYLRGWIKALKDDPDMAVAAGGQAQRAVDFILGTKFED